MYKLYLLIYPLMLASLACLQTTITPKPTQPATVTPGEAPSGEVFYITSWTPTPETYCAIVTAAQSLHLRDAPNDRAAVVDYLTAGERVTLDQAAGRWWEITTATGAHGYSNSYFMQVVPCP